MAGIVSGFAAGSGAVINREQGDARIKLQLEELKMRKQQIALEEAKLKAGIQQEERQQTSLDDYRRGQLGIQAAQLGQDATYKKGMLQQGAQQEERLGRAQALDERQQAWREDPTNPQNQKLGDEHDEYLRARKQADLMDKYMTKMGYGPEQVALAKARFLSAGGVAKGALQRLMSGDADGIGEYFTHMTGLPTSVYIDNRGRVGVVAYGDRGEKMELAQFANLQEAGAALMRSATDPIFFETITGNRGLIGSGGAAGRGGSGLGVTKSQLKNLPGGAQDMESVEVKRWSDMLKSAVETSDDPAERAKFSDLEARMMTLRDEGMTPEGAYRQVMREHRGGRQAGAADPTGSKMAAMFGGQDAEGGVSLAGKGYGKRADGTEKGPGFLGEVKGKKGETMTELSVGVEIDGRQVEIPTIVPGLSASEMRYLKDGGDPRENEAIMRKAIEHAKKRIKAGKSPFADESEAPMVKDRKAMSDYVKRRRGVQ